MRSIWSGGGRTRKGVYVSCLIKVRRINYTYLENTGKEKKKNSGLSVHKDDVFTLKDTSCDHAARLILKTYHTSLGQDPQSCLTHRSVWSKLCCLVGDLLSPKSLVPSGGATRERSFQYCFLSTLCAEFHLTVWTGCRFRVSKMCTRQ